MEQGGLHQPRAAGGLRERTTSDLGVDSPWFHPVCIRSRPNDHVEHRSGRRQRSVGFLASYLPKMTNRPKLDRSRIPTYTPAVGVAPICPHCGDEIDGLYQ